MSSERGQATVEWTGLMLMVALALGGLAAAVRPAPAAPELGEALAERIAGAAAGAAAREEPGGAAPLASPPRHPAAMAPPARPHPPRASPLRRGPRPAPPGSGIGFPRVPVGDAFRWLRGAVGHGINRVWIGCLAHRRFRYGLRQGQTWIRPMPPGESFGALNECLNPVEFLGDD